MSESDLGSDESRRAASLKRAVKRADRDHARWMRFYVMLLVVPIVIAGSILTAGRSDRDAISAEVNEAIDPIRADLQGVRPELAVLTQQIRQLDGVREALDGVIAANQ